LEINLSKLHKPLAANLFCFILTLVPLAVSSADKKMLHKNSKPLDRHKLQTSGGKRIDALAPLANVNIVEILTLKNSS
jgi:hypothetical protein